MQTSLQRVRDTANIERLCLSEDGMVEVEAFLARFARLTAILARLTPSDAERGVINQACDLLHQAMRAHDAQGWAQIAIAVHAMTPAQRLAAECALASRLPE